mmetsp:Transcript_19166/g.40328  ORF Transcript_19166/g.40328 Transcript_19166/m.40328 type:complete len:328 (+) Transcript_19166:121-1104(+)
MDDNEKKQQENAVGSMSAARNPSKTAPPSKHRDGFELVSRTPIRWTDDNVVVGRQQQQPPKFVDITYHISIEDRCARIAFNRPNILHAFRPQTIREIQQALLLATDDVRISVVVLTSNVDASVRTPAFCAGGDQQVRSNDGGYQDGTETEPKLRVLELQVQMRRSPKPILCVVDGYAIGGGHILHMISDLTIASKRSVFGQTGPRMGSFDAGYGSTRMARLIGQKRARELWFLCRYMDAEEASSTGLINACYPHDELEGRTVSLVQCSTERFDCNVYYSTRTLHKNYLTLPEIVNRLVPFIHSCMVRDIFFVSCVNLKQPGLFDSIR